MKTLLVSAAFAAIALAPTAAAAQNLPPAVIAVVDLNKVSSQCKACQTATNTLRSQETNLQNRAKSLTGPLETEQKAIQAAIDALQGRQPDAALQARIRAFEQKRQQGAQELQQQQAQIQRNAAYVQQQIQAKLNPIYSQVMQRRGANRLLETGSTLATATTVDVTADIVAALNAALPSVSTTAPAQPQQPQSR